jgi:integrase
LSATIQKKRRRGKGEGSISFHRPSKLWRASIQIGLDDKGKPVRQYVARKRREDVVEKLRELQNDHATGRIAKTSHLKVGSYLDKWLEDTVQPTIRYGTYQNYRGLISNKIKPLIGGYRLVDLNALHIQNLFATLARDQESPYRRQQVHAVLYSALRTGVIQGLIPFNPCEPVRPPRLPDKEMHILDAFQSGKLLEAARGNRLYALYFLALATGMRQGEMFGLKWSDVNFKNGTLSIQRTVVNGPSDDKGEKHSRLTTNAPKTKRGKRLIDLPVTARQALREHQKRMLAEGHLQWVFCDSNGGLLRRSNFVRREWRTLLEKVNEVLPQGRKLPIRFRFHDLRHTAASLRLAQGDHPKIVQELLGHARISITLDLYSHVMPSLQSESAEKMDRTLAKMVRGS